MLLRLISDHIRQCGSLEGCVIVSKNLRELLFFLGVGVGVKSGDFPCE